MAVTIERLIAEVEANPAGAIAALEGLSVAIDVVARDRTATIDVDVDQGAARAARAMQQLEGVAGGMQNAVGGAMSMLSGLGGAASQATTSLGGASGAGKGLMSSFSMMGRSGGNAVLMLVTMAAKALVMGTVLAGLYSAATIAAGALQALAAAGMALYGALAPLVGLLGALPVGLGSIVGVIGTIKMGMGGISEALSAVKTAEAGSAGSTYNAAAASRQLRDARRGIVDATKQVTKAEENLARATKAVADARVAAAGDLVQYRRDVRNALWDEEEALRRLKQAQENLDKAQKKAGKSGAILSKETDDFTGKIYEVARVSADAIDEQEDRADAEWAVVQAQRALTLAQERTADSKKVLNEAERRGIEGSERVQSALEQQKNAQEALADAHENVARAQERLADVQAMQAEQARGGAAANSALRDALAELTPAGREFVRFLVEEFMPAWKKVKDAAQEGLLPGVQAGLTSLMQTFPIMADEAKIWGIQLGSAVQEILSHFTTEDMVAEWLTLSEIFRDVMFGSAREGTKGMIDALIPLGEIFISVTKAAAPMTKMLTNDIVDGLNGISRWMKKPENAKKMEGFFTGAYEMGGLFMKVVRGLGGLLWRLAVAARPLGEWFLKGWAERLGNLNKKLDEGGLETLKQWFEDMKPALTEGWGLVSDFFKALFTPTQQGAEDSPLVNFLKSMREDFIPAFTTLLETLGGDNEGASKFSDVLTSIITAITNLVEDPQPIHDFIDSVKMIIDTIGLVAKSTEVATFFNIFAQMARMLEIWDGWQKLKENNRTGIETWERDLMPRIDNVISGIATALDMIPIVGPIMSALWLFLGAWWKTIMGIFVTGDIGASFALGFEDVASRIRRAFANALNPVIEKINEVRRLATILSLGKIRLDPIAYIDAYKEKGPGKEQMGLYGGSGAGMDNLSGGGSTGFRTTRTVRVSSGYTGGATRQFGGPVEGGRSYIVGEKRAEVLTLPDGMNGRIASAVPRPAMQSTGDGISEAQLQRILEAVLAKAKPNVDMKVEMGEEVDPRILAAEIAWAVR